MYFRPFKFKRATQMIVNYNLTVKYIYERNDNKTE